MKGVITWVRRWGWGGDGRISTVYQVVAVYWGAAFSGEGSSVPGHTEANH